MLRTSACQERGEGGALARGEGQESVLAEKLLRVAREV